MLTTTNRTKFISFSLACVLSASAWAEVTHEQRPGDVKRVRIIEDVWQPEGFEEGLSIPALYASDQQVFIDGVDNESIWARAEEVTVPLAFGEIKTAWVKALYTDEDVFFRVRWEDATENRMHHPWIWDDRAEEYIVGTQIEDSLMFSFEAGCEWFPSFLSGYAYDFDAWHWMAARTDPLGLALDLSGSVKDADLQFNTQYTPRFKEDQWNLRFIDRREGILHNDWQDLDRQFMLWPAEETVYFHANLDGLRSQEFTRVLEPIEALPASRDPIARFEVLDLPDNAKEVSAKGVWADGFWTVELRRSRETPGRIGQDMQFTRLTQFSLHVFDGVERLDQSSESDRLWFVFLPKEAPINQVADNLSPDSVTMK